MTSNPITDELAKYFPGPTWTGEPNRWRVEEELEDYKLRLSQAQQALYEAVKGCVPEVPKGMDLAAFKRVVKSGGLHPNSTKYQSYKSEATMVEIAKAYRNETLTNLSLLFGVTDVGNLDKPEATNSQPQLADNRSEEG